MKNIIYISLLLSVLNTLKAQISHINFPIKNQEFFKNIKENNLKNSKLLTYKSDAENELFLKAFEKNASELVNCVLTPPSNIATLTGGYQIFDYHLTSDQAYKLGVIGVGEASSSIGKEIYIYDHMYYKNDKDCLGHAITYGAGVRLIVTVKQINANVNLNGLGAIAASAEMKFAEVTVSFKTIGLSGKPINDAVPSSGAYNIEKHVEYLNAINLIRSKINDPATVVTPEIISVQIDGTEIETLRSLITAHAIKMISDGKNYVEALSKIPNASTYAKEILTGVYNQQIGRADNKAITQLEKIKAKEYYTKLGF